MQVQLLLFELPSNISSFKASTCIPFKLSPSLWSRESLSQSRAQLKKCLTNNLVSNGIRTHDLCDTSAMLLTLIGAIEPTES